MRPLVAVRRAAPFNRHVFLHDPLFRPLERAVEAVASGDDFPCVYSLAAVFEGEPPVRFVVAAPRKRRKQRGEVIDLQSLYDARITIERVVPTRERCWHDLMNALVWGTFPRAKSALHARQHRALAERLPPNAQSLPPTRTRELDALALLDEGGVAILTTRPEPLRRAPKTERGDAVRAQLAAGVATPIVFGHAIYESLALGVRPAVVAALVLSHASATAARGARETVMAAEQALVEAIENDAILRSPDEFTRIDLTALASRDSFKPLLTVGH